MAPEIRNLDFEYRKLPRKEIRIIHSPEIFQIKHLYLIQIARSDEFVGSSEYVTYSEGGN
jgi:hypothetical protein